MRLLLSILGMIASLLGLYYSMLFFAFNFGTLSPHRHYSYLYFYIFLYLLLFVALIILFFFSLITSFKALKR